MEFPKLILSNKNAKKSSLKQTQKVWQIKTKIDSNLNKVTLITESGELNGRIKSTQKVLSNIKLSSKKGISTLEKYAKEQAKKLFNNKKKEGYIEYKINSNNENEINDEIKNIEEENKIKKEPEPKIKKITIRPYYPMLAYQYNNKKSEIKFPCFVQPKLDGVRCVVVDNKLYSRNGNRFPVLPHIEDELKLNNRDNLILDGELFTDDINFEKIVGLVKKFKKSEEDEKNSEKIYLNVFDYIDSKLTYEQRLKNLNNFFEKNKNMKNIKQVKTEECKKEENINDFLEKYTKEGFEGVIIRNKNGIYEENNRSVNLQKLKKFIDEEFEIIDYTTPNIGKEVGCVIWICKTKEGKKFNVRPSGNYKERKNLYRNAKKYIGKMLTVRYQELTNGKVPRFPVGVAIRDYE
jgi:DNA ligase-1